MSDEVKSALEIALERASRLGKLAPEEAQELKWHPEGERLAALYLRGEADLSTELARVPADGFKYALKALVQVLVANLGLPRRDADAATNRKVAAALKALCADGRALDALLKNLDYVLEQYTTHGKQQLQQGYEVLKQQFFVALQRQQQQQGQLPGQPQAQAQRKLQPADVETLPEFQSQWRATVAEFEQQYEQHLAPLRQQLQALVLAKPRAR